MNTLCNAPKLQHDAMMEKRFGTAVSPEGKIERRIVYNLGKHLEDKGFRVYGVHDGDDFTKCSRIEPAMEVIFNLDQAHLYFRKVGHKPHWVFLVLGNGIDIVSDYSYSEGDEDGFLKAMDAFNSEDFA
jgi:hypothetical protein